MSNLLGDRAQRPFTSKEPVSLADKQAVTGPSFRFRLERVRAVREQKVDEGRLGVQAVAEHHVNGARIRGEHARQ